MTTEGDKDKQGEFVGNGLNYRSIGNFEVKDDAIVFDCPKGSVTTFFGK